MKKTLLFGMFLCGASASFAQKNAPVYTERIDSIISTGVADIIKKNYEYNKDGSCTMTQMSYDFITRRLIAKQVVGYDKKGQEISVYTYNLDEEIPNAYYLNYEYSYDNEGRKVVEKEYNPVHGQTTITEIDYSGVTGYPKVVTSKLILNGEETGMGLRKFYNADDNVVLEERGTQYDSGEWKISHRYVTEYENNVKKTYTHYRSYEDGIYLDYQELYYANGKLKEHNDYYPTTDVIENYKKYDEHGNITEEYTHGANSWVTHDYYKNTYDSEGRLIEKVKSQAYADHASERERITYVYKKTKSGIAYYVENCQIYSDGKWNPYATYYYVQSKVEDGIVKEYSCLYTSYAITDSSYSFDIQCIFYSKEIKDKASETAFYRFNGEEPAFLIKYDNYKFSKWGDLTSYDLYRNPLLLENKGDNLTFIGTNKFVYDEKVLGSSIFLGGNRQYKLLYEVLEDANGKEVGRTNYYYSPYKAITTGITTVASSDKAQTIYNLNGQKVETTQAGQIYIQNGKKFIAK